MSKASKHFAGVGKNPWGGCWVSWGEHNSRQYLVYLSASGHDSRGDVVLEKYSLSPTKTKLVKTLHSSSYLRNTWFTNKLTTFFFEIGDELQDVPPTANPHHYLDEVCKVQCVTYWSLKLRVQLNVHKIYFTLILLLCCTMHLSDQYPHHPASFLPNGEHGPS